MRTRLLVMVAVAVAAVASGRIARAQTPCMTNVDCPDDGVFCNGTESCDTNIQQCVSSGDPCFNGAECNNGPCDENTHCATPAATACTPDANACTADQCDGSGNCTHPANVTCDDGQFCNGTETCDAGTGQCVAGTGPTCDDGHFCNGLETCNPHDGTCVLGSAPTCDDGMVCTADSCDPAANNNAGGCVNAPIAGCCTTDADCDDGDVCTGTETCVTGACQNGTPLVCDNGNPCDGLETCDPVAGCQAGTQLDCNDNLVCTNDSCDPAIGCVNAPIPNCCVSNGDCDDGDICNGLETCVNNTCVAGTPPDCDDHNPCTADTCDAVMAC